MMIFNKAIFSIVLKILSFLLSLIVLCFNNCMSVFALNEPTATNYYNMATMPIATENSTETKIEPVTEFVTTVVPTEKATDKPTEEPTKKPTELITESATEYMHLERPQDFTNVILVLIFVVIVVLLFIRFV